MAALESYCNFPEEQPRPAKAWEVLKQGWAQGCYARNSSGEEVEEHSKEATNFCLMGALRSVYGFAAANVFQRKAGYEWTSMARWNDAPDRTQEEVVELLKSLDL